jgi:hypothetical protein
MDIKRILQLGKQYGSDADVLKMIIANRIDFYLGDELGSAVSGKQFDQLAADLLEWHNSKAEPRPVLKENSMNVCAECGMPVDKAATYHPYAACLMFKACQDSEMVQANLDAAVAHGYQLAQEHSSSNGRPESS